MCGLGWEHHCFNYLQNNKALKLENLMLITRAGFNYLQNNKALKLKTSSKTRGACFNYLQNNKALKPNRTGYVR